MIPDRFEFFSALKLLRRGHLLVRFGDFPPGCAVDGSPIYSSFQSLVAYRLIERIDPPGAAPRVEYYRIAPAGIEVEARLRRWWREQPLRRRIELRLFG
jgi:hypothetical protein